NSSGKERESARVRGSNRLVCLTTFFRVKSAGNSSRRVHPANMNVFLKNRAISTRTRRIHAVSVTIRDVSRSDCESDALLLQLKSQLWNLNHNVQPSLRATSAYLTMLPFPARRWFPVDMLAVRHAFELY
ncbi:hypothetical protein PMAYCL1PPCAC_01114, partial [Pristionchus mayeri]